VTEFLTHAPHSLEHILVLPSFGRKKRQKALIDLACNRQVRVETAHDFKRLDMAQGALHQGVVALAEPVWETAMESLPSVWGSDVPLLVVCDEISDPGNLGAIIRSSAAFGAHAVIISQRNSADINGTVIKASAGAIVHLHTCMVDNMAKAIETLKEMGIWTAALVPVDSMPVWDADMRTPLALVLGAEGKGLRPLVMRRCDIRLHIPQSIRVESLNVAAACTAALYETWRQRRKDAASPAEYSGPLK